MYSHFYRSIQNIIVFFLQKKNFRKQLSNLIYKLNPTLIIDVGGADGIFLKYFNLQFHQRYICYDINELLLKKGRRSFHSKNIKFVNKNLNKIKIKTQKKCVVILNGVFHHVSDEDIKSFLIKNPKVKIIAIDPMFHKNQNIISIFLKKLDRGKFIRKYDDYNILSKY